ncbi:MAG TPA: tetratricopeptide repeat protein [Burkholderiaceae bacterium]|nr:tetratricopeptide repeat protein [Burkholderiaceae bacterium]
MTQILPLDDAVMVAANALFGNSDPTQLGAAVRSAGPRLALTIDPPIDSSTGLQSVATRAMQQRVVKLVREQYPLYELKPFTGATIAAQPLLLVGTLTTVDKDARPAAARDAFRICLALVDLRNGRIVSNSFARARPAGVDLKPTRFFTDSPAWAPDAATQGYVKTCQETQPGDPINPTYSRRLPAAVLINDATVAYEGGRYEEAYQLFKSVQRIPGGDQLRVYNGLYLASQKLGRRDDAIRAFGHLVDFGLAQRELVIKFLFRLGSASFADDPQVSGEYPVWLSVVSQVAERRSYCIQVAGPPNERLLSLMRAQYIKQRIDAAGETIANRTSAVAGRENPPGSGADDAADGRVQFRVLDCKARPG